MKANELRIGNFVNLISDGHENEPDTFQWGIDDYEFYSDRMSFIKPIPLTEEWLLKLGFGKDGESPKRIKLDCDFGVVEIWVNGRNPLVKYVHQLQNLYFALTGEELTLQK